MKMILTTLVLLTLTANAENVAQPPEPYVLTLFPDFLEMVNSFNTRDACVAQGVKLVNSADYFTGFICDHGRAWQKDE